ncbi:cellulose biosynthesis protein BcsN [Labrys okinawensis]|uniref:cellulose biosynthesis protein BcsN n=1 Tax=Labrys okinawensis TaxID=346911 RepID=UPI0039BD7BB4
MEHPADATGLPRRGTSHPLVIQPIQCTSRAQKIRRWSHTFAILLSVGSNFVLSGCSAQRAIISGSAVTTVPPEAAFVSLGAGTPAVVSILQTAYANATRQTMALATDGSAPGQNQLRVDIFGVSNESAGAESTLADRSLSEDQLTSEAEAALPGVPMRRSLTYVQNQYGPFGYALGRAAGELCIYAWQRIATPDLDVSLFNRRATISIRLRLCEPHATETNLVAAMMGLHVNASLSSGSWSQAPRPLSPDLGAAGAPMGPSPASVVPTPAASARTGKRKRPRVPARAGVKPAPETAQPDSTPAGNGVMIPPPPAVGAPGTGAPAVPPPPVIPAPPQGAQP